MPSLSDWDRVVGGRAEAPAESAAPEQPEQPQVLGMDESEDISSQNPFAFESSAPFEMDQLPREESLEAKGKAELKDQLKVYAKDPMFVNALHNSKTSEVFLETRTEQLYLQDTRLAEHEGEPPDELKKQIREETFQRALAELLVAKTNGAWNLPVRIPFGLLGAQERITMRDALRQQTSATLVPGSSNRVGFGSSEVASQKVGSSTLQLQSESPAMMGIHWLMAPELALVATGAPDALAQALGGQGDMSKQREKAGVEDLSAAESVAARRDMFDVVLSTEFAKEHPRAALVGGLFVSLLVPDLASPIRPIYKFGKAVLAGTKKAVGAGDDVAKAMALAEDLVGDGSARFEAMAGSSQSVAKAYGEALAVASTKKQADTLTLAMKAAQDTLDKAALEIKPVADRLKNLIRVRADGAADQAALGERLGETLELMAAAGVSKADMKRLGERAARIRFAIDTQRPGPLGEKPIRALLDFIDDAAATANTFNKKMQAAANDLVSIPRSPQAVEKLLHELGPKRAAEVADEAYAALRASLKQGAASPVAEGVGSATELIAKATRTSREDLITRVRAGEEVILPIPGGGSAETAVAVILGQLGLRGLPRQTRMTVAADIKRLLRPWVTPEGIKVNTSMLQSLDENLRGVLALARESLPKGADEVLEEIDHLTGKAAQVARALKGFAGPIFITDFDIRKISKGYRIVLNEARNMLSRVDQDIRHIVRTGSGRGAETVQDLANKYLLNSDAVRIAGKGMSNSFSEWSPWDMFGQAAVRGVAGENAFAAMVRATAARGVAGGVFSPGALRGTRRALRGVKINDETIRVATSRLQEAVRGQLLQGRLSPDAAMDIVRHELTKRGIPLARPAEVWTSWIKIIMVEGIFLQKTQRLFGAGLVLDRRAAEEFAARITGYVADPDALSPIQTRMLRGTMSGTADLVPLQEGSMRAVDEIVALAGAEMRQDVATMLAIRGMNNGFLPKRVVEIIRREIDNAIASVGGSGPGTVAAAGVANSAAWWGAFWTLQKRGMTSGVIPVRRRYFLQNHIGDGEQIYTVLGLNAARRQMRKQTPQLIASMIPGAQLAIGPISKALDNLIRPEMTKLLEAGTGTILTRGGHATTWQELHEIAVRKGLFETFASVDLAQDVLKDAQATGLMGKIRSLDKVSAARVAEEYQIRQKLGVYLDRILIDGVSPTKAADEATEALFDYRTSLTPTERKLLSGFFLPWWTWEKNNHMMVAKALVSPAGAAKVNYLGALSPFASTAGKRVKNIERHREHLERQGQVSDPNFSRNMMADWVGGRTAFAIDRGHSEALQYAENHAMDVLNEVILLPEGPAHATAFRLFGAGATIGAIFSSIINKEGGGDALEPGMVAAKNLVDLGDVIPIKVLGEWATGKRMSQEQFGREIEGQVLSQPIGAAFWKSGMARRDPVTLPDGNVVIEYRLLDGMQPVYDAVAPVLGIREFDQAHQLLFDPRNEFTMSQKGKLIRVLGFSAATMSQRSEAAWRKAAADKRLEELTEDADNERGWVRDQD